MIQAIQLILALSFLVLIHELGHFTFARIFKVRVEKFYMFFNPWLSLVRMKKFDGKWHVKFFSKNEDEEWKTIKVDFCGNNALLKELKAEFTNDEEFYTIFGFFKDKDGQIKRDLFCESTFTSELYGYIRCGHWGPSNPNDMFLFNIMVNYAIPGLYIDPENEAQTCANVLNQEIEEEKEWTAAREASAPAEITKRQYTSWWEKLISE